MASEHQYFGMMLVGESYKALYPKDMESLEMKLQEVLNLSPRITEVVREELMEWFGRL